MVIKEVEEEDIEDEVVDMEEVFTTKVIEITVVDMKEEVVVEIIG